MVKSPEKVFEKSGNLPSKVHRNPGYIVVHRFVKYRVPNRVLRSSPVAPTMQSELIFKWRPTAIFLFVYGDKSHPSDGRFFLYHCSGFPRGIESIEKILNC